VSIGLFFLFSSRDRVERDTALQKAQEGRFEEAEGDLRKVIERHPSDVEVAAALARGSSKAASEQAEADLDRWVRLQPNHPEPLKARLEYYRRQKDYEKGYRDARQSLALTPKDGTLQRTVMNMAFSSGHYPEAEEICRELLKTQPHDASMRSMLAQIRRAQGDLAGAATILDQLLSEQPKLTSAMMSRAAIYEEMGQVEKAIPLYREVMQIDSTRQLQAGYQLSLALERAGQSAEAAKVMAEVRHRREIEAAQEAIKSQPGNVSLEIRLAQTYLAAGQDDAGLMLLENLVARDRDCAPAHAALADYYDKHGNPKRAAEHRRKAGPG